MSSDPPRLVKQIDEIVAELLPQDPRAWCESYKGKHKIVHDAVWGTIHLADYEVAIVDTALLQRLRRIHQTGAAHLVYPGAKHTRFEHSLGVAHQAEKLCRALQLSQPSYIDESVVRNARLAALLHDTGHGPCSHTSEQYFGILADFDEVKSFTGKYAKSGQGEILSCLIARSEPMKAFFIEVKRVFEVQIDEDRIADMMSGELSERERWLSEFIHGPFDADKLDYMYRDGHYSGLQIPIDLDRLYYSIAIVSNASGLVTRLAGSPSATAPLMQIAFNKILLFAGVYHHHKVRAVDCMIWSIFDMAFERSASIGGVRIETPADFLRITDDELFVPSLCDDPDIAELITSVRNRDLWKRALVVSRQTIPEESYDKETGDGSFADLIRLGEPSRENIAEKKRISRAIASKAGVGPYRVWLDVPKPASAKEAEEMWIKVPGDDEPKALQKFMPIKEWIDIYAHTRYAVHVFCPNENRRQVNEAAQEVLKEEFELEFEPSASIYAKIR